MTQSKKEQVYTEYFKDTFDKLDLKRYAETKWSIEFRNDSFRVQLLDDRGLIELGISPVFASEHFTNIRFYNSLLTLLKSPDKLSGSEKRKIIGTRLDFKAQAVFMADNFDELKEMLTRKNYQKTFEQINNLGQV